MPTKLTTVKTYLGKHYKQLNSTSSLPKYRNTGLSNIFDQSFLIQDNKCRIIVDATQHDLSIVLSGNEVYVSKRLFNYPGVFIGNPADERLLDDLESSLYTPDVFSTISYLICQNHIVLNITEEIEEPVYIRYTSELESFYNSVLYVNISEHLNIEIVEEYKSKCALNSVTNYVVRPEARLNLFTFYDNYKSATSYSLRNVIVQPYALYTHILMGKGSEDIIDENRYHVFQDAGVESLNCINSTGKDFHSIANIYTDDMMPDVSIDFLRILSGNSNVSFSHESSNYSCIPEIDILESTLILDTFHEDDENHEITEFLEPITDRAVLERFEGSERFYKNKTKFLN